MNNVAEKKKPSVWVLVIERMEMKQKHKTMLSFLLVAAIFLFGIDILYPDFYGMVASVIWEHVKGWLGGILGVILVIMFISGLIDTYR